MPPIVTPGQLQRYSELYHQLGTMVAAGLPLPKALEIVQRPTRGGLSRALARVRHSLSEGATFAEAVASCRGWLPAFDAALLHAGEQSGRLDASLRSLADYYGERVRLIRSVIQQLLYPGFLLHFAVFLLPVAELVQTGRVDRYLRGTLGVLLPLYAVVLGLVIACQGRHGEWWRRWIERAGHVIPMLGRARHELALARLAAALEALTNAGISVTTAWEIAAAASGSPALRRAIARWGLPLQAGKTPGELVASSALFPEVFANLYQTGEISGQLDESLRRLSEYYREEGTQRLRLVAIWLPRLLYVVLVGVIAMKVLGAWQGIFQQYDQLLEEL